MLRAILLLALSLFVAQAASPEAPARFSIAWNTNGAHRVSVCGSNIVALLSRHKDWQSFFQLHVESSDIRSAIGLPPITGQYLLNNDCLWFRPQFPFEPGIRYRATFRPPGEKVITSIFEIPHQKQDPTTVVTQIYPTSNVLPENLLKFYLHFSAPMSGGHIYEHIQLTNEREEPVELPFLEIDEELWNSDMTRLTLFLDPGRIKRGVKPLEEVGPALESGKSYTLNISTEWLNAQGVPLKESFQKKFVVADADRVPPDVEKWKITVPRSRTRDPLQVEFTDPMDHALALRMIHVEKVRGENQLAKNERLWTFVPAEPWVAGQHRLTVQTTIEDLAGNNIGKPFEVDLFSGVEKRIIHETVTREFKVE